MSFIETKSFDEIKRDWESGKYIYHDPEPTLMKVGENHIFDEDLTVRQNREMAKKHNEAVLAQHKARMSAQADLDEKFKQDYIDCMKAESVLITTEIAEKIYEKAYADKHSCMSDFFYYIEELFELVDDCIRLAK